jgi:hypothetical protein
MEDIMEIHLEGSSPGRDPLGEPPFNPLVVFFGWPTLDSHMLIPPSYQPYRNLSLGLTTKAKAYKVSGQERKLGSERKCEGMNPHTPKGASTLGVGVPVDFRMFRKRLQGQKTQCIDKFFIPLKSY